MKLQKIVLFLISFFSITGFCQQNIKGVSITKGCPIHEAFLTKEVNEIILQPVAVAPPMPLNEKIPQQPDPEMKWISGYWSWSNDSRDFLWVSGVWRKTPQGLHWISGYWKHYGTEYGWIPGFWTKEDEGNLQYISEVPPEEIQEVIPTSPGEKYFWKKGYWEWDGMSYQWKTGRWQAFEENFVYTPARYVWRDRWDRSGYVFVPSFYDWTIEKRGVPYACAKIDPALRSKLVYEPVMFIQTGDLLIQSYPYYPNYLSLYHHHNYFHADYWARFSGTAPWWGWSEWWTMNSSDTWDLFWWWGHNNTVAPSWMTPSVAAKIAPPNANTVAMLNVPAPSNMSRFGMVKSHDLVMGIQKITGRTIPFMPSDPDHVIQLMEMTKPQMGPEETALRPTGNGKTAPIALPLGKVRMDRVEPRAPVQKLEKPSSMVSKEPVKKSINWMNFWKGCSLLKSDNWEKVSLSESSRTFNSLVPFFKRDNGVKAIGSAAKEKSSPLSAYHYSSNTSWNLNFLKKSVAISNSCLTDCVAAVACPLLRSMEKCRSDLFTLVASNDQVWKTFRNFAPSQYSTPAQSKIPPKTDTTLPISQQNKGEFMNNPKRTDEMRPGVCYHGH